MLQKAIPSKAVAAGLTLLAMSSLCSQTLAQNVTKPVTALNATLLEPHPDKASGFISSPQQPLFSDSLVDYRTMSLFKLKEHRHYHPSPSQKADDDTIHVEHTHQHNHWGTSGYGGYWGHSRGGSHSDDSFTGRVSEGLTDVAVLGTVFAISAAAFYSIYKAATLLWPYVGAASLTAIELPATSPWKITGYKMISGSAIREREFQGNEDALESVREYKMFDRQENPEGRFLLLDQENWWGLVDYPTEVNVTFTRMDTSDNDKESITVAFKRGVTNGMGMGTVNSRIIKRNGNAGTYHLKARPAYAGWLEFSKWYNQPARILVDFLPVEDYSSWDMMDSL